MGRTCPPSPRSSCRSRKPLPASAAPCAAATSRRSTTCSPPPASTWRPPPTPPTPCPSRSFLLAMLLEEHKEVTPPARQRLEDARAPGTHDAEHTGWLLDLYTDPATGLALWLLDEDGSRRLRLRQPFPVTFYAAGPPGACASCGAACKRSRFRLHLSRDGAARPVRRCSRSPCWRPGAAAQPTSRRSSAASAAPFPSLTYYDADMPIALRHAAAVRHLPAGAAAGSAGGQCTADPGAQRAGLRPGTWTPQVPPLRILLAGAGRATPRTPRPRCLQVRRPAGAATACRCSRPAPCWSTCAPSCAATTPTCC